MGKYKDEFIFETDENVIATNDISEEEMFSLKKLHFLMNLFWSVGAGKDFLIISNYFNINPLDVIMKIFEDTETSLYKKILKPLEEEFRSEWFNTEEELISFYQLPKNNKKLLSGEEGLTKLNLKYLSILILNKEIIYNSLILLKKVCQNLLKDRLDHDILEIIHQISLDKLRLDLFKAPLKIRKKYFYSHQSFKTLINYNIIPKNTIYKKDYFFLEYSFPETGFNRMVSKLKKNNFEKNPYESLYSALTIGSAKFLYKLDNSITKIDLNTEEYRKDILNRADNIRST